MKTFLLVGSDLVIKYNIIKHRFSKLRRLKLIGVIADDLPQYKEFFDGVKVLGKFYQIPFVAKKYQVDEIIVSIDQLDSKRIDELIEISKLLKIKIKITSKKFDILSRSKYLSSDKSYSKFKRLTFSLSKRIFDLFLSTSGIIYFTPFLLILILIMKLDNLENLIVKEEIVGKQKKIFSVYRLNFNEINNESFYLLKKIKNTSLDYIPILLNIFAGQISFVGPRLIRTNQIDFIPTLYDSRFNVKPGIISFSQLNNSLSSNIKDLFLYDNFYAENPSYICEIKTILSTLFTHSKETISTIGKIRSKKSVK